MSWNITIRILRPCISYVHGQAGADVQVRVCTITPQLPHVSLQKRADQVDQVPPGGHVGGAVVGGTVVVVAFAHPKFPLKVVRT